MAQYLEFVTLLIQLFEVLATLIVVFSGAQLLYQFFTLPKVKATWSLSDKHYHLLRSTFVHRIIFALDVFLVSDLLKLTTADTTQVLVRVLLIVVIRTILAYFLTREIK